MDDHRYLKDHFKGDRGSKETRLLFKGLVYILVASVAFLGIPLDASAEQVKKVQRGYLFFDELDITTQEIATLEPAVNELSTLGIVSGTCVKNKVEFSYFAPSHHYGVGDEFVVNQSGIGGEDAQVQWQAVEWNDGVTVHKSQALIKNNTSDKTINLATPVAKGKSFPIIYGYGPKVKAGDHFQIRATLQDEVGGKWTKLYLDRDAYQVKDCAVTLEWQIVEMDAADVQDGVFSFTGTSTTVDLTSGPYHTVTENKSFLVLSSKADDLSGDAASQYFVTGECNDNGGTTDTLTFTRGSATNDANGTWYLIEMQDATRVERGLKAMSTTTTTDTINPSVDMTESFSLISIEGAAILPYNVFITHQITASDTITFTSYTATAKNVAWQVIELPKICIKFPNGDTDEDPLVVETEYDIEWVNASSVDSTSFDIYINTSGSTTIGDYSLSIASGVNGGSSPYPWTVPAKISGTNLIGETNRVAITNSDDSIYDISDNDFIIKGSVTIAQPDGSWLINDSPYITWDNTGDLDNIGGGSQKLSIYLSADGGTFISWALTTTADPGTVDGGGDGLGGSWQWPNIPETYGAGNYNVIGDDNMLRLELNYPAVPTADTLVESISAPFTIMGKISAVILDAGDPPPWTIGETHNISWTKYGKFGGEETNPTDGTVKIRFSSNGITYPVEIRPSEDAGSSYDWQIPKSAEYVTEDAYVMVEQFEGGVGAVTVSKVSSQFTINYPTLTVSSPDSGTVWEMGDTKVIHWSSTGLSGSDKVQIQVSVNNEGTYSTIAGAANLAYNYDGGSGAGSFPWTIVEGPSAANEAFVEVRSLTYYSDVYDANDTGFTVQETLHVDVPNATNIVWRTGVENIVEWTAAGLGTGDYVNVYYDLGGGSGYQTLALNQQAHDGDNTGSCPWTPDSSHLSNNVKIKVQDDERAYINDESDNPFKIKGLVSVSDPSAGEGVPIGEEYTVNWSVSAGTTGTGKVTLWNGIEYVPLGTPPIEQGYFGWTPTEAQIGSGRKIKVALDGDENLLTGVADETGEFYVTASLNLTRPDDDQVGPFNAGGDLNIWWEADPSDFASFGNVKMYYVKDSTTTYIDTVSVENTADGGTVGYTWSNIPQAAVDTQVKIYITQQSAESLVNELSDKTFEIKGGVVVSKPTGSTTWTLGSTGNLVQYSKVGDIGNVDVLYSLNGGESYTEIVSNHTHSSDYYWDLDPEVYTGLATVEKKTNARIKVRANLDTSIEHESVNFTINASLTDLSANVNGGGTRYVGDDCNIEWTTIGTIGSVDLYYCIDGSTVSFPFTIKENATNTEGYEWGLVNGIPDKIGDTTRVIVESHDYPDINVFSYGTFAIRGLLTVTHPTSDDLLYVGDELIIQWGAGGATIGDMAIDFTKSNGGDSYGTSVTSSVDVGSLTFDWTVPDSLDVNNTDNKFRLTPADTDKAEIAYSDLFTIKASLDLTYPDEQSSLTFSVFEEVDIKWDPNPVSSSFFDKVKVYYDTGSGTTFIATVDTDNQPTGYGGGEYGHRWTVPEAASDPTVVIRIEQFGEPDDVYAISQQTFEVQGGIELINPGETETPTWYVGQTSRAIEFNKTGVDGIDVEYSLNSGEDYINITSNYTGSSPYYWDLDPVTYTDLAGVEYESDVKINLKAYGISGIEDESTNDFTIRARLYNLNSSPIGINGGGTFNVGDDVDITWSTKGTVNTVDIYYCTNGSTQYADFTESIFDNITNDNAEPWVDIDDSIGTELRVMVRHGAAYGEQINVISAETFSIIGKLVIDYPTSDDMPRVDEDVIIQWTPKGTIGNMAIHISKNNGGDSYITEVTPSVDTGSLTFDWTVPDTLDANNADNKLRFTPADTAKCEITYSDNFTIMADLELVYPSATSPTFQVNDEVDIKWDPNPVSSSFFDKVKVYYDKGSGTTFIATVDTDNQPTGYGGSEYGHRWTVPVAAVDDSVVIRVEQFGEPDDVYDISAQTFEVKGDIELVNPGETETPTWYVGQTSRPIEFVKYGVAGVDIEYSLGEGYNNIVSNYTGSSPYSWDLDPATYTHLAGVEYENDVKVKVKANGISGVEDESTDNFTIRARLYNLNSSPSGINAGGTFKVGDDVTITWSTQGTVNTVDIYYCTNGSTIYADYTNMIFDDINNDNAEPWVDIDDSIGTELRVIVRDGNNSYSDKIYVMSADNFNIIGKLVIDYPTSDDMLRVDEDVIIQWTPDGTIGNMDIYLSQNGGQGGLYPIQVTPSVDTGS
ncbi:hypothetical protein ACFL3N_03010, partial [Candidatus Omnitrophota bacterium]